MNKWTIGALAGFALLSTPALADEPAEAAPERKICKTERATGSLTRSRRICMTQAEWDQLRRDTQKDLADMQRNGGAIPRTINGSAANQGGMTAGFQ